MLIEAVGIGLLVTIVYYTLWGLMPGGLIVPGYIALFLTSPFRILSTLLAALITFFIVKHFLYHFLILYGRRRFLAMIMVGFIVKWLSDWFFVMIAADNFLPLENEVRVIGYIISGLIANTFFEQGIWPTISSLMIVSAVVRLILIGFVF